MTENWSLQLACEVDVQAYCLTLIPLCPSQLLDSPFSLLTNSGTMLWDKLCWLLALLALSSGTLTPSNEPLSAPRIFLSFKGKALKLLLRLCLFSSVFLHRQVDVTTGEIVISLFNSWFCSLPGVGKLLALAGFGLGNSGLYSRPYREFDCVPAWERREERDADCSDYSGPENISSFNRRAAISSPNRPLCDLGSILKSSQI